MHPLLYPQGLGATAAQQGYIFRQAVNPATLYHQRAVMPALRRPKPRALSQDDAFAAGLGAATIAGLLLLGIAVNYQIGKAMAPSKNQERKWAWGNAIGGTIFPPTTVGLALYKNYFMN